MGIFSGLKKAARAFKEDMNTPESFKIGEAFEDYVRKYLFPADRYEILHKTHNYAQNGRDFVGDSKEPDFTFRCLESKKKFHLEAKYRSDVSDQGTIRVAKQEQFERHRKLNDQEPVFVCIGISGKPESPEFAFLIPMGRIRSITLSEEFLEEFEVPTNRPVPSKKLWSLVPKKSSTSTIRTTGFCIRCRKTMALDPSKPLCPDCYREWRNYSNPEYTEKYCHSCGKPNKGSILKPVCYDCYKKLA